MTMRIEPPVASLTLLEEMLAASPAERDELVEDFARLHDQVYLSVAGSLCQRYRLDAATHIQDVHQIVHEVALLHMRKILEEPAALERITSWQGWIAMLSRNAIQRFRDSPEGASGVSALASKRRRNRRADTYRLRLRAELGREPLGREIIERANADLEAGPGRSTQSSNMLLSAEDLSWDAGTSSAMDLQDEASEAILLREGMDQGAPADDDDPPQMFLLMPGEPRAFLAAVLKAVKAEHGERVHQLASTWISPALKKAGLPLSQSEVCEACGAQMPEVEEAISLMRSSAMCVLRTRLEADPEAMCALEEFARERGM